jgi:hypothetical protein
VEISFTPSPDLEVILNTLLDKFEDRFTRYALGNPSHAIRSPRCNLRELDLPGYFSQIDPHARMITNEQLQTLEQIGAVKLAWNPGETGHLLQSVALQRQHESHSKHHETLYTLLHREPLYNHRTRLESLLLADKFRYPKQDWRARALEEILAQLRSGRSPSPFSLTDSNLNLDLLAVLAALPTLTTETPYRVFSVRIFNNSKRFEDIKPSLVRLARRANPEWKSFTSEDLLRELNLVANPGFIHLAGNWELTDLSGQIINLDCFVPSVGFPASQIARLEKIAIRAEAVLCIENLTSFHAFTRKDGIHSAKHAVLCLMGNPSPSIRHLLRLIPAETPIYLWSDMDYGGFNILSQLRRQVDPHIQPYLMDIATFDTYADLSRPLTQVDTGNLKRLARDPVLRDIHPTIEHILQRGLKLEQEAIWI